MHEFNISKVLDDLRKKRKYFSSEADFQLALAMQIEREYGESSVICEYVPQYKSKVEVNDENKDKPSRIHMDIIYRSENIPIELKYRTKKAELYDGDNYRIDLANQDAHDEGCYGFWRDVCRIGEYKNITPGCNKGYVVFLTNDVWYKEPDYSKCKVDYKQFNLNLKDQEERSGIVSNRKRPLKNVPIIKAEWKTWDEKENFHIYIAELKV